MEHRVYTALTQPIMLWGVPAIIFAAEAGSAGFLIIMLRMPIWFIVVYPFIHLYAAYLTSQDPKWYKSAMVKGKYFSKNRPLIKGRVRYNA